VNETWLSTRLAVDWEIPVIERARRGCSCPGPCPTPAKQLCARSPELELLAGLLTEYRRPEPGQRPVTEVAHLP
jgi:hypothetical protein